MTQQKPDLIQEAVNLQLLLYFILDCCMMDTHSIPSSHSKSVQPAAQTNKLSTIKIMEFCWHSMYLLKLFY